MSVQFVPSGNPCSGLLFKFMGRLVIWLHVPHYVGSYVGSSGLSGVMFLHA